MVTQEVFFSVDEGSFTVVAAGREKQSRQPSRGELITGFHEACPGTRAREESSRTPCAGFVPRAGNEASLSFRFRFCGAHVKAGSR